MRKSASDRKRATTAQEVRAFVKKRYPDIKFSVRLSHNPFGGDDKYAVKVRVPDGVSVISSGGSREPTRFAASDPQWTATMQDLYDALVAEFSNAFSY